MRVLIAGGGVAGAAAACLLGPDCVVVEREAGAHDKICGEFLSTEAVSYLRRLGLDPAALGAAPVERVRLVHHGRVATAELPFTAYGLSRRVLDAALLELATSRGAQVVHGHAVRAVRDGVAEVAGLGRFPGHAVFLATGKHELRGWQRHRIPGNDLVGLKMHLRLDPSQMRELGSAVEIILLDGGYGGLQPIGADSVNLCVLLERRHFQAAGQSWDGVQALLTTECPHLARRLAGAHALFDRPLSIYRVPYGFVHTPSPDERDDVYRLGDQAGVIPSFAGDGIAIALHSAFLAARCVRSGGALAFHRRLRGDISGQIARASLLYRLGRRAPGALVRIAALWPGAVQLAARLTRLPSAA